MNIPAEFRFCHRTYQSGLVLIPQFSRSRYTIFSRIFALAKSIIVTTMTITATTVPAL